MQKIRQILTTSTAKDSLIMFIGTILVTVCGFFVTIVLTRNLSAAEFGLFVTALAFTQLISDLIELGLNSSLLNLYPPATPANKAAILKTSFGLRFIISVIVSLVVFSLASPIEMTFFKNPTMVQLIQYSALGILFFSLTGWGQTVFQSKGKFMLSMLAGSLINISRLGIISILVLLGTLNLFNGYFWVQTVIVTAVAFCFIFIDKQIFLFNIDWQKTKQILYFGLPVGLSFSVAAVYSKLDQILMFNIAGETEAGIYGLAFRVAALFIAISAAFGSALTPRFSSMAVSEYQDYFKKALYATLGLASIALISVPLAPYFLPIIFGPNFISSVLPFQILAVGIIFFMIYSPFYNGIVYHFKKPQFTLLLSLVSLVAMWGALNLLIPLYQSVGGALAVSSIYFFQMLIAVSYYIFLEKTR